MGGSRQEKRESNTTVLSSVWNFWMEREEPERMNILIKWCEMDACRSHGYGYW